MILIRNIDLTNLVNSQPTSETQSIGFDKILNELLKILSEKKEILTDNNFFVFPYGYIQTLLQGNNMNFQEISQMIESSSYLKTLFSNILNQQNNNLSNMIQSLQTKDKSETNTVIDTLNTINTTTNTNTKNTKELVDVLISYQNKKEQAIELSDLNKAFDNFTQEKPLSINSFKEIYSESQDIKFNKDDKIINNEKLSSQVTLDSIQSKNYQVFEQQQNIELPLSQLRDVSNIVLKAISNSKKVIIVQLEPPELGRIMIKLSMDNSGLRADMKVDYPHVKEVLTGLIPEIKSNLQSSGIKVSDFLLDLTKQHRDYSDSYNGQGQQKKYKGNERFIEYFA